MCQPPSLLNIQFHEVASIEDKCGYLCFYKYKNSLVSTFCLGHRFNTNTKYGELLPIPNRRYIHRRFCLPATPRNKINKHGNSGTYSLSNCSIDTEQRKEARGRILRQFSHAILVQIASQIECWENIIQIKSGLLI